MNTEHLAYQPFIKQAAFYTEEGICLNLIPDEHVLTIRLLDANDSQSTLLLGIPDEPASFLLPPHRHARIEFLDFMELYEAFGVLPSDVGSLHASQPNIRPSHASRLPADFTTLCKLVHEADGCIQVAALAEMSGYSPRHVTRLFDSCLGVSAKAYCRMVRFHAALSQIQKEPGREISWFIRNLDYSDQAHFQREFKSYMGITPHRYIKTLSASLYAGA